MRRELVEKWCTWNRKPACLFIGFARTPNVKGRPGAHRSKICMVLSRAIEHVLVPLQCEAGQGLRRNWQTDAAGWILLWQKPALTCGSTTSSSNTQGNHSSLPALGGHSGKSRTSNSENDKDQSCVRCDSAGRATKLREWFRVVQRGMQSVWHGPLVGHLGCLKRVQSRS